MENVETAYLKEHFDRLASAGSKGMLQSLRKESFHEFLQNGVPTPRQEEWRFTPIGTLFHHPYSLAPYEDSPARIQQQIREMRIPGSEDVFEIVFVNGRYRPQFSKLPSESQGLEVWDLEQAARGNRSDIVEQYLAKSSQTIRDGLHALNTSFISEGALIYLPKGRQLDKPVVLYHLMEAGESPQLSQPRVLVYLEENSSLQLVETHRTFGTLDSFSNEVMEVVVGGNARFEYYAVQKDVPSASQVHTVHIRQIAQSLVHAVTVSLDGGVIRNNTDLILESEGCESHLYGLYLLKGRTHVDNHTLVDNRKPNCYSNEFYKGILDEASAGVFNGKIFVRQDAQKTNAYQSNKNILLSDNATIHTKPQLEIFADDVKCSHGCTVGQLDEEALFYLISRGISRDHARSMLLNAFSADIVEQIKWEPLALLVQDLITARLRVK